jgi:hypothetical protein
MQKEYEEKLEVARKLITENDFSCEEGKEKILQGFRILQPIAATGDIDVLYSLFDFFPEETEYEVCEGLENLVFGYFTSEQILQAYYRKFDSLAEKNLEKCVSIARVNFFGQDDIEFEEFRKMFNTIKSPHSGKFFGELKSLLFAGPYVDKVDKVKKYRYTPWKKI